MKTWIYTEFTKMSTIFIILTQWIVHWEDIVDRFVGWLKLGHLIDRREKHEMSLITSVENAGTEISALIALEPLIVKFVQDAIAAYPVLKGDGELILAKVESIFHATTPAASTSPSSPAPTTPPPAAA